MQQKNTEMGQKILFKLFVDLVLYSDFYPTVFRTQTKLEKTQRRSSWQSTSVTSFTCRKAWRSIKENMRYYGFSSSHVCMWELDYKESWVLKNWCFCTVVWRRLLRAPWAARRSNQSILKEISPCSLEGLMWRLKLQYFGHLMRRADSFEKTLMLGKIEGRSWRGWERIRWLVASPTQWTWIWVDPGSWWWIGRPSVLWFMGLQRVRHDWATEQKQQQLIYNIVSVTGV